MTISGELMSDLYTAPYPALDALAGSQDVWRILLDMHSMVQRMAVLNGHMIHPDAEIFEGARVQSSYVGARAKLYPGTLVRDSVILEDVSIGHCTEVARSWVGPECFLPRFNYVGGSLLGRRVQIGGGVMFATERHDRRTIVMRSRSSRIMTESNKIGSLVGDDCVVAYGCHVNPGSVIGHDSWIMPGVDVRGYVRPNAIVMKREAVRIVDRRAVPRLE